MKIVTGYTGTPHVTSNAAQALNQGIFGSGNSVLNVGNKFAATLTDANTVTIQDGEGIMQGVHFRIDPGTTETATISNGTSGYKRIDLICARYTKNAITGVEDVSLVVIEGTPDASSPSAPSYNTGTILTGSTPVDYPLYKVSLDGLTPTLTAFDNKRVLATPPDLASSQLIDGWNPTDPDQTITFSASGWYLFYGFNTNTASELYIKIYESQTLKPYFSIRIPSYVSAEATSGWLYFNEGDSVKLTFTVTGNVRMYYAPCL